MVIPDVYTIMMIMMMKMGRRIIVQVLWCRTVVGADVGKNTTTINIKME